MNSNEVRQKFLKFFEDRGHKIVPSSSLVPEGDISVLFTTAGMQQFKGYYSAPDNAIRDFGRKNVVTVQKCIRTGDIDEVGDATHLSFFEMLGNFSFGGYGRKEAIEYAYEFITKELGLPISYVTVYKGEGIVPKDEESRSIWQEIDSNLEVREDGADVFWGPTGDSGPCGPTTEIYCKNADGEDVEIWNIVFNEYFCDGSREKLDKGEAKLNKLETLGIDTGMGFERLLATVQKKKNVYETDLFELTKLDLDSIILPLVNDLDQSEYEKSSRIILDHIRSALIMSSDGIISSSKDRGYVLRRLIRRAIIHIQKYYKKTPLDIVPLIISSFAGLYTGIYPEVNDKVKQHLISEEAHKFLVTLDRGLKEFEKAKLMTWDNSDITWGEEGIRMGEEKYIDAKTAFDLYQTHGFPIELTVELARERGYGVAVTGFKKLLTEHQKLSQAASAGMFKGGLANHEEKTIKLHTAHHLLLAGLKAIVSKDIKQRGSNINEERLRMDFLCDHKLTDEDKQKVETWVNDKIKSGFIVERREMLLTEAEKLGAEMEFGAKYPDTVSVYMIEDKDGNVISKEFCGGPHISNSSELGVFKIQKEEAVAAGIRRIKATIG